MNDQKNRNVASNEESATQQVADRGSIDNNNHPEENKQEDYVKDDQQSDLSYGRNNGRESDSIQDQ